MGFVVMREKELCHEGKSKGRKSFMDFLALFIIGLTQISQLSNENYTRYVHCTLCSVCLFRWLLTFVELFILATRFVNSMQHQLNGKSN